MLSLLFVVLILVLFTGIKSSSKGSKSSSKSKLLSRLETEVLLLLGFVEVLLVFLLLLDVLEWFWELLVALVTRGLILFVLGLGV